MIKTFKGTIWIHKGRELKRVTEYEYHNYYMPQGYTRGMK